MAKIFITGVAGFIGSHLLAHSLKSGYDVVGIDNFLTGKRENIDAAYTEAHDSTARFDFFCEDIRDRQAMIARSKDCDFILHEAAIGSVPWSIDDPFLAHETNLTGFLNVLEAARQNGIKRTVYASSSAVFGSSTYIPSTEGCEGEMLSPYASTKRAQEIYAQSWARTYHMQIIGLRYFNVFGPRQDPNGPYAAVIPRWIDAMMNDAPCTIFGDGSATRDYCYIDNVVRANFLALDATWPNQPADFALALNIGCGAQTSLVDLHRDMAEIYEKCLGKSPKPPEFLPARPGDIAFSFANIDRARAYLHFEPKISAKNGLELFLTDIFAHHSPSSAT